MGPQLPRPAPRGQICPRSVHHGGGTQSPGCAAARLQRDTGAHEMAIVDAGRRVDEMHWRDIAIAALDCGRRRSGCRPRLCVLKNLPQTIARSGARRPKPQSSLPVSAASAWNWRTQKRLSHLGKPNAVGLDGPIRTRLWLRRQGRQRSPRRAPPSHRSKPAAWPDAGTQTWWHFRARTTVDEPIRRFDASRRQAASGVQSFSDFQGNSYVE